MTAGEFAENSQQQRSIALLERALATELVCMFRYRQHYCMAKDVYSSRALQHLQRQAEEEATHAERIAGRIAALGGTPDLRLQTTARRSYVPLTGAVRGDPENYLPTLLDDDLIAEQIAADAYRDMIADLGDSDAETSRLLSDLIAAEERHVADLRLLVSGAIP